MHEWGAVFTDTWANGYSGMTRRLSIATKMALNPSLPLWVVGKGTGQGLAIVHSVMVGKHGGNIQAERAVGTGTTFVLRLPLNETQPISRKET